MGLKLFFRDNKVSYLSLALHEYHEVTPKKVSFANCESVSRNGVIVKFQKPCLKYFKNLEVK